MKMKLLELINDWRDSIYYGTAIVMAGVVFFFGDAYVAMKLFFWMGWVREQARMVAWIFDRTPVSYTMHRVSAFVTFFLNAVDCFCSWAHGHDSWMLIFLALNLAVCGLYALVLGSPETIFRLWWKNLFDYPRKQKPPKRRKESAAIEALKKLMAKLSDLSPMPQIG